MFCPFNIFKIFGVNHVLLEIKMTKKLLRLGAVLLQNSFSFI